MDTLATSYGRKAWIGLAGAGLLLGMASVAEAKCQVASKPYGTMASGQPVEAWTLRNGGISVTILTLGGILYRIDVPDREGHSANVVRNLDSLKAYEGRDNFSSLIGRFANRISGGSFELDGQTYKLAAAANGVTSHGGPKSFGARIWQATAVRKASTCGIDLTLSSPDGDNGFPGQVDVTVHYRVSRDSLTLAYQATTTKPTVVNFTDHAYFNLAGHGTVYDQRLTVNADSYLPTDAGRIPTGEIAPVSDTPMDMRKGAALGEVVTADNPSIHAAKGLDHTFVLNGWGKGMIPAARLSDPASGRTLSIRTTQPGLVVYTANSFDGSLHDSDGDALVAGAGVALETQYFPDSPHHTNFPSTVLRPGETFKATTVYTFSAK